MFLKKQRRFKTTRHPSPITLYSINNNKDNYKR